MSGNAAETLWEEFRPLMPVAERWAYLDHAAVAPIPRPTADAIHRWAEQATSDGELGCREWYGKVDHVHVLAAQMMGCDPEEIAIVSNTSHGINIVAFGLDWRPGDNVVFPGHEFPTNQYPWLALRQEGVEVRRVMPQPGRPLLDLLRRACDRRTRLIAVSWVQYLDGYRIDLDRACELAHDFGALLCLDAIQGLGVFTLDLRRTPVDFLAADGHKWLLGPEGAGIFFVRREHLDRLRPIGVGWHSVVHARDFSRIELDLKPSAARFEGGTHNVVGSIGLAKSLEILLQFGTERISRQVLELTDRACERLAQLGAVIVSDRSETAKSGIVAFEVPGVDPAVVRNKCLEAGVVLSVRAGKIRISPHAYNNEDDLDRLIDVVCSCRKSLAV
jgi:cysteine desulfurase/selenocysteine lyase